MLQKNDITELKRRFLADVLHREGNFSSLFEEALGSGIHAIGFGVCKSSDRPGLRIYVMQGSIIKIPDGFEGHPVTRYDTRIARLTSECGSEILNGRTNKSGTLGCLVDKDGARYMLSNSHVIAGSGSSVGDPIFVTGVAGADPVGKLCKFDVLDTNSFNLTDSAIAIMDDPSLIKPTITTIGIVAGATDAACHDEVVKYGVGSQDTDGTVVDHDMHAHVEDDEGNLYPFEHQLGVTDLDGGDFSEKGDSGALLVRKQGNLGVGLLFALNDECSLACPLLPVLANFGVVIAQDRLEHVVEDTLEIAVSVALVDVSFNSLEDETDLHAELPGEGLVDKGDVSTTDSDESPVQM